MTKHVRIQAVRRDEIDVEKLAHAVLLLARERAAAKKASKTTPSRRAS